MEHLLILFFATFSAAFMATVPPGLLNMNAAKASVEKGKLSGVVFSLGVALTVMVQAYVAVNISKFLYNNPVVIDYLLKAAIFVFAFFAIYFFVTAKREKVDRIAEPEVKKRSSFYRGILLAAVNFLTIPYYSSLNAMWKEAGWIKFEATDIAIFVVAASAGTFAVLYLYVFYFNKLEMKTKTFSKNSNYIISALMLVLLMITLIRIFYN
ncbi:lysine transporter LysE [Croceivirga radicis]|uniref:Lysine transporter LysE n=1 Tax=Croceivirga radicis TaxID=1929488 RepID=A0A1V6LQY4_9FLAO|nr:LysE family transporter [Croceivirga radicis]OQD42593.1 lysine transporter LysE [Croceivirga radicis]